MLTWEEVRDTLAEAHLITPEEFVKHTANYMPQDIIGEIADRMHDHWMRQMSHRNVVNMVSAYMMGLHVGWYLCEKATKGGGERIVGESDL